MGKFSFHWFMTQPSLICHLQVEKSLRLASKSPCKRWWPCISNPPVSTSGVLGWESCCAILGLSFGEWSTLSVIMCSPKLLNGLKWTISGETRKVLTITWPILLVFSNKDEAKTTVLVHWKTAKQMEIWVTCWGAFLHHSRSSINPWTAMLSHECWTKNAEYKSPRLLFRINSLPTFYLALKATASCCFFILYFCDCPVDCINSGVALVLKIK